MRIWALFVLTACSGLHTSFGGGGGGGGTGGGGGGGGNPQGGGTGQGGGTASNHFVKGDAGTFSVQDISPPHMSILPNYLRVAGTSKTDVVVADSFGQFQHFDGLGWQVLYQEPNELEFTGLYVTPAGEIFAAGGEDQVYWCLSNCTQVPSWKYEQHQGITFAGLCGSGESVYAVGHSVSDESGVVFRFSSAMGMWQQLTATNGANDYEACAIGTDGTLFIAANRYVVELAPNGDARRVELDISGFIKQWNAIALMGDEVIMVGEEKSIARRSSTGEWSLVLDYPNFDAQGWTSVASVRTGEAVVGGLGGDSVTNIGTLALVDFSPVVTTLPDPHDFYIRDLWPADVSTWFLVGETNVLNGGSAPVVYRLTR